MNDSTQRNFGIVLLSGLLSFVILFLGFFYLAREWALFFMAIGGLLLLGGYPLRWPFTEKGHWRAVSIALLLAYVAALLAFLAFRGAPVWGA